jgi:hypothetical protein
MPSLMRRMLLWPLLFAANCTFPPQRYSATPHERAAAHYDATADTIAWQCWKARRGQVAVTDPNPCRNAEDSRLLEANRAAADEQRAQAADVRAMGKYPPLVRPEWLPEPFGG